MQGVCLPVRRRARGHGRARVGKRHKPRRKREEFRHHRRLDRLHAARIDSEAYLFERVVLNVPGPHEKSRVRRKRRMTGHHDVNRVNGGTREGRNMIRLEKRRHAAWHLLFGDRSALEVIMLLLRLLRWKGRHYDLLEAQAARLASARKVA